MRRACLLSVVAVLSVSANVSFGDGLIYQLPPDGSWARYDIEFTFDGKTYSDTLTISSVGTVTGETEDLRWIEFARRRGDATKTTKLLIPEKNLKIGETPLYHIARAWRKVGDGETELLNPTDVQGFGIQHYLLGPLSDRKKLDTKVIETEAGKFACEGLTGKYEYTMRGDGEGAVETFASYDLRLNKKAPFGVVAARLDITFETVRATLKLKLTAVGTDAKSEMPQHE